MPVENLICSPDLKPFFSELPMPTGLNGNEAVGKKYFEAFFSKEKKSVTLMTEVYRQMQYLHDALNSGRFFVCLAQRNNFPEIYSEPTPEWANNWIKSQFVESSIFAYNAAFDFLLQVIWLSFELYKYSSKLPQNITNETLDRILAACTYEKIKNNSSWDAELRRKLISLRELVDVSVIHNLCNEIKHRKKISYTELSEDKHPIMICGDSYNSSKTLAEHSITDIIGNLKKFHNSISAFCGYAIPICKSKIE